MAPTLPADPARFAAVLVGAQAAALVALAAGWTYRLAVEGAADVPGTIAMTVIALVLGLGLGVAARSLWRGRRWSYGPAITWQLLLGAVAVAWLQSNGTVWAWLLLGLAVVTGIVLLLGRANAYRDYGSADPAG